jgi:hypothetical protein
MVEEIMAAPLTVKCAVAAHQQLTGTIGCRWSYLNLHRAIGGKIVCEEFIVGSAGIAEVGVGRVVSTPVSPQWITPRDYDPLVSMP